MGYVKRYDSLFLTTGGSKKKTGGWLIQEVTGVLVVLLQRSSCWGGNKKKFSPGRRPPSGHRPMSANQQCAADGPSLPALHMLVRNIMIVRPLEKYTPAFTSATAVLLHLPSFLPVCCFLKEKCERRKKRGKECSARGGRWRKPHFFRRAAVSGLLRWL